MNSRSGSALIDGEGRRPRRWRPVIVAGIVVVACAGIAVTPRVRRHYIPRDALACARITIAGEREGCFETRFRREVRAGRLPREFGVLREMVASGWLPDCHLPAHLLGRVAFEELGSGARALAAGTDLCSGGYVHAVAMAAIPVALQAGTTLRAAATDLCLNSFRGSAPWGICAHGVGHGAFVAAGSSYEKALALCATLPADEQRLCSDGSAMQNSMRLLDLDSVEYERVAPGACTGRPLSDAAARACNEQIGEIAVFHFNHRFPAATALCARLADQQAQTWCLSGVEGMRRFGHAGPARHWHDRFHIPINPPPPPTLTSGSHGH